MKTSVEEAVGRFGDALTVKRVFGEPYEKNGVTVIPAASVIGGGGGGQGEDPDEPGVRSGSGSGFGLAARPAGAYIIRGEEVSWRPAIDVNRIAGGVFVFALLRLLLRTRGRRFAARRRG